MRPTNIIRLDYKKGFDRNAEYLAFHRDNIVLWFKWNFDTLKYVVPIGLAFPATFTFIDRLRVRNI
jgi:hypothetical protein